MNEIKIDSKSVDSFAIINPFGAVELKECIDSILHRLSRQDGTLRRCLIYPFTEEELDILASASEWLLETPVFKKKEVKRG